MWYAVVAAALVAAAYLLITVGDVSHAQTPPPAASAGFTLESVAHDSVTLTRDDPGEGSITGYQVPRRSRDGEEYGDGEGPPEFVPVVDDIGSAATTYTDTPTLPPLNRSLAPHRSTDEPTPLSPDASDSVTTADAGSAAPARSPVGQADTGICNRTQQVQDVILSKLTSVDDCADVTANNLASITGTFSLSDRIISRLKPEDFDGLTGIDRISLNDNFLRTLPRGLFTPVATNIERIDILRNVIIELPTGTFSGLTNLTSLDLRYNRMEQLPTGLFDGLTGLTNLNLSGNGMTTIAANDFSALTGLTELDLSNNRFTSVAGSAFSNLGALER